MGRMHSNGKGLSGRVIPYKRTPPSWLDSSAKDVIKQICNLAKKGHTPSQIGSILRDSHGVGLSKPITGCKITLILRRRGLAPKIPEDLFYLIKKAIAIRKHLEFNTKDLDSRFRLRLIEARIHRTTRYYKTTKALPPTWKYDSANASSLLA